ncbi:unnamed protein product [Danaus chrysippus]|uniref:(African queen) hypothetical protein n=1 Tax=Danaus chrysippus TaxID=151541 RepID=A0A8J2VSU2_9NEOP|nr:unnamed protein product [Danaus chrysippus]
MHYPGAKAQYANTVYTSGVPSIAARTARETQATVCAGLSFLHRVNSTARTPHTPHLCSLLPSLSLQAPHSQYTTRATVQVMVQYAHHPSLSHGSLASGVKCQRLGVRCEVSGVGCPLFIHHTSGTHNLLLFRPP